MPTASEHTPELTAVDLSCIRAERVLFQKLSFTLPAGKLMLVLGANGSGKTSLLRILAGLSAPVEGQVRWNRGPLAASRRDIHYIGHLNGIKEALTPRENLIVAGALMASERNSKVDQAITWCGLDAVSDVPAAALSSGQVSPDSGPSMGSGRTIDRIGRCGQIDGARSAADPCARRRCRGTRDP
jgi:heme exporter protein A